MIASLYEPFKHWSDGGSIYLISDPHFEDTDTNFMNPNWIEPNDHLAKINAKILKNDTVVCLGDCGNLDYFKKMKSGKKILIKGNHDDKGNSHYLKIFDEVYSGPLFITDKILLSHEPIFGLPFCCNIHGHVHGGDHEYYDATGARHINIASDVVDYNVFNLGDMIKSGIAAIPNIHRVTINRATEYKIIREGKKE